MKGVVVNILIFICLMTYSGLVRAGEHDHRDWNLVSIGRLVTLERMDISKCGSDPEKLLDCSAQASEDAVEKLNGLMEIFECRTIGQSGSPSIDTLAPLSQYDGGPLLMAELDDVQCSLNPKRQLFPVEPQSFAKICSGLEWKCDAVWIPDGDPSVWYINAMKDVRR